MTSNTVLQSQNWSFAKIQNMLEKNTKMLKDLASKSSHNLKDIEYAKKILELDFNENWNLLVKSTRPIKKNFKNILEESIWKDAN